MAPPRAFFTASSVGVRRVLLVREEDVLVAACLGIVDEDLQLEMTDM